MNSWDTNPVWGNEHTEDQGVLNPGNAGGCKNVGEKVVGTWRQEVTEPWVVFQQLWGV